MSSQFPLMLFSSGENTDNFANKVAAHLGAKLEETIFKQFSDGDMFRHQKNTVRDRNLFVICQTQNDDIKYKELFECFTLVMSLRQGSPKSWITVIVPYLPYSRQDKASNPREPILAHLIPVLLKAVGADQVVVVRLHNSATKTTAEVISMENIDTTKEIIDRIRIEYSDILHKCKIVSPDFGGAPYARYIASELGVEIVVVDKRRKTSGEQGVDIFNVIGDIDGYHGIMVDDIADTCSTATKAKNALMEKGALSVHLIATHPVLSGGKAIQTLNDGGFESVILTNSRNLSNEDKNSINNYREIGISKLVSDVIENLHNGDSLHKLWEKPQAEVN